MKYERPSTEDTTGSASSLYGESNHEAEGSRDERTLYGEPCHEVESDRNEQTLYGEPQHESQDERRELPDVDLLFARMRAESVTGPTVLPPRLESQTANTTER
ncbi:hypothetical protein [Halorussus caseinilyticus]|uniref:Uncharacterized protein n=1 Tax=Halorussus caseinilyticus TaxID=3034025 RepID=A0ABD5WN16_9EURY|nr:hypothetical protein [Halorussus sp. DT72]